MKARSEWKQPKRCPLPPRTSWLKSSTKPIARGAKPKAVNAVRKRREFQRTYHSKARVEWVKSQPCVACRRMGSVNAHTTGGGMSRKGDYTTIVPLCHVDHVRYDEYLAPFDQPFVRELVASAAALTEKRWQAHCAEAGAEP